jgi:hypothetical protein
MFRKLREPHLIGRIVYKFVRIFFPSLLKKPIAAALNYRENRVHPFVDEALSLVPTQVKTVTNLVEPENHRLKGQFNKFGSDKENLHSYAWVYSELIGQSDAPKILEIGLGSLNGFPYGGLAPGGSMKAWRGGYPNATLVGADVDEESVKAIDEIGFVADQTSDISLQLLKKSLVNIGPLDLIVDDGFHDPHANMRTLLNLYSCVKPGGHFVIEDVHFTLLNFWRAIESSLPGKMTIYDLRNQRPGSADNILLVFEL